MKTKRIMPYQRLMERFKKFANEVEYRKRVTMWLYPKDKLKDGWPLDSLYERVQTAEQLGYDVCLFATTGGLEVKYAEKLPKRPWNCVRG